jgi:hypothetical protein
MTGFFLGSWDLFRCLEMNFDDGNLQRMMSFFKCSSPHYPGFDDYVRELVVTRFGWAAS